MSAADDGLKLIQFFISLISQTRTFNLLEIPSSLTLLAATFVDFFSDGRFEHPAGGYKKIFETCEELSESLPATVIGLFASFRQK